MGVVTLDPPERSIGDHLGAGGVVGTEVDVAGRYEAWASRIVPLWATTASAKARSLHHPVCCSEVGSAKPGLVAVGEGRGLRPVASLGIEVGWTSAGQADWSARTGQQATRQLRSVLFLAGVSASWRYDDYDKTGEDWSR